MRLALVPTGAFTRDLKRMARRHVPLEPVEEVLDLIAENSEASLQTLKAHHRMHMLQGYAAVYEGFACSTETCYWQQSYSFILD